MLAYLPPMGTADADGRCCCCCSALADAGAAAATSEVAAETLRCVGTECVTATAVGVTAPKRLRRIEEAGGGWSCVGIGDGDDVPPTSRRGERGATEPPVAAAEEEGADCNKPIGTEEEEADEAYV